MSAPTYSCPQCATVYFSADRACDWCGVATLPVIETRPAIPAECWNETPVNTDAAMDATRVMCGGAR